MGSDFNNLRGLITRGGCYAQHMRTHSLLGSLRTLGNSAEAGGTLDSAESGGTLCWAQLGEPSGAGDIAAPLEVE